MFPSRKTKKVLIAASKIRRSSWKLPVPVTTSRGLRFVHHVGFEALPLTGKEFTRDGAKR